MPSGCKTKPAGLTNEPKMSECVALVLRRQSDQTTSQVPPWAATAGWAWSLVVVQIGKGTASIKPPALSKRKP
jgi:hypothetical protein